MKILKTLFVILLTSTFNVSASDTLDIGNGADNIILYDFEVKTASLKNLTETKIYLTKDSSLYSGVVIAEIERKGRLNDITYSNIFVGNYEQGQIQEYCHVSFGGGKFTDDTNKNKQAGLLLAQHKKISAVFKNQKCRYKVERKNYPDSIETTLKVNVFGTTDDTISFIQIKTENNVKTECVTHFHSENKKRIAYKIRIANEQIIDIDGEGIIYLNLNGKVVTKEDFLEIAKNEGSTSFSSYYFLEDDPNYAVILFFSNLQGFDPSYNTNYILKRQRKMDAKMSR